MMMDQKRGGEWLNFIWLSWQNGRVSGPFEIEWFGLHFKWGRGHRAIPSSATMPENSAASRAETERHLGRELSSG